MNRARCEPMRFLRQPKAEGGTATGCVMGVHRPVRDTYLKCRGLPASTLDETTGIKVVLG